MATILKLGTKRLNDASWHFPQTTPVPLPDRCRYATAVATRHIPSWSQEGSSKYVLSRSSFVRRNDGLERIRMELGLKDSP